MPGQPTNTGSPIVKTLKMITQTQFILLSHRLNSSNDINWIKDLNMSVESSSGFRTFSEFYQLRDQCKPY